MRTANFLVPVLAVMALSFSGCLKDTCHEKRTYTIYEPVYRSVESIRSEAGIQAPRELRRPGKIYSYGNWLLINEIREGIHLINNSDPASPANVAFLAIPGNGDMAIYDDRLYADSYMDLVVFDITQMSQPQLVHRIEDQFRQWQLSEEGVVVDYRSTQETLDMDCSGGELFFMTEDRIAFDASASGGSAESVPIPVAKAAGLGGSMARFTIAKDHFYVVDRSDLYVFGLQQPQSPQLLAVHPVGWNIETIFPYRDHLFIGSETGMYIFDNAQPAHPALVGIFEHARACDPVVTDGQYAYVTLRDGTECLGFLNQMDVVDIADPAHPRLVKSYAMTHPMGLAVRGDHLFLCDDFAGLRIFDKSDVMQIGDRQLAHMTDLSAYDVIALPGTGRILVIGPDGFSQYDASDPASPVLLSRMAVTP